MPQILRSLTALACLVLAATCVPCEARPQGIRESRLLRARTLWRRAPTSRAHVLLSDGPGAPSPPGLEAARAPPSELAAVQPRFSWRLVLFFAANPLALLPIAGIGALCHVPIGGAAFALNMDAIQLGVMLAAPLILLMSLPFQKLPGLGAFKEVDTVSHFLTYLLFGGRRGPAHFAKVLVAAVILSTAAGVAEELAFRGALQGGVALLLARTGLPAVALNLGALLATSALFGQLHSYSSSPAYRIAAFFASAYFGALYLATNNVVVPIVAHFMVDMVAFVQGNIVVAYTMSDAERAELWECDQPIAVSFRQLTGYESSPSERARGEGRR
jgi:membrane protease YdiL (CAAX protease family)